MATHVGSQAPSNSSDAYFRAWGSEVGAQLAAMGLVNCADAGDIDWTTVLAPALADTVQGFEMFRFADALQATAPVFIKVEYGSGAATNTPAMWITVGEGTDGAGTLTGAVSTRTRIRSNANTTTLFATHYSGDTNRIHFHLFYTVNANYTIFCSIERTKDAVGSDTADGVLINLSGNVGGTGWNQQYLALGVGPTTIETRWGVLAPSIGTGSSGPNCAVYSVFLTNGVYLNPPLGVLGAFQADVASGASVTLTVYNANHTYFFVGTSASGIQAGTVANPVSVLMRFE